MRTSESIGRVSTMCSRPAVAGFPSPEAVEVGSGEVGSEKGVGGRKLHVMMVCCGQGFPSGMAISYRLKMVGLGLLEQGARVSLYHIGGSPYENPAAAGDWRGIRFRYLPPRTRREPRAFWRRVGNLAGLVSSAVMVTRRREGERRVVYSAGMDAWADRMLAGCGVPVVADHSEWYPEWTGDRALYRRFSPLCGVVAISREIEQRISAIPMPGGRRLPILRVPILLDGLVDGCIGDGPVFRQPYFLWIGSPRGEIWSHIRFLVRVFATVRRTHPECRLAMIGEFTDEMRRELRAEAAQASGGDDWLLIHEFVPKDRLALPVARAAGLLAPLPRGLRWECCFPTKLGEYLVSGRPVVSSTVGEVGAYLADGDTAMLAAPEDADDCAGRVLRLLEDPELAERVGRAGRALAMREFDYHRHADRLFNFLDGLAER